MVEPTTPDPDDEGLDDDNTEVLSRSALNFDGYDDRDTYTARPEFMNPRQPVTGPSDIPGLPPVKHAKAAPLPTGQVPVSTTSPTGGGTMFSPVIKAFFQGLIEEHERYIEIAESEASVHNEAYQNAVQTREQHKAEIARLTTDLRNA